MKFTNEFDVDLEVERAWSLLTDLEAIAPCLPGAELLGADDNVFRGRLTAKVGPMTATYTGTAVLDHADADTRRATIVAKGMDTRGAGSASATIDASLQALTATRTAVVVTTDLRIAGRFAQFGSAVLQQVSAALLEQFAENLEQRFADESADESVGELDSAPADAPATAAPLSVWRLFLRWLCPRCFSSVRPVAPGRGRDL